MKFGVVVEKDEDGYYVASVPELSGCHTQAKTLDEVMKRIKKAIGVCLEVEGLKSYGRTELASFNSLRFKPNEFEAQTPRKVQ
jgi:predicted RNase H-like HicB family nuclease